MENSHRRGLKIMKKRLFTVLLAACLFVNGAAAVYADEDIETEEEVSEEVAEESGEKKSIAESVRDDINEVMGVEDSEEESADNGLPSVPEEGYEEDPELLAQPLGVDSLSANEADVADGEIIEAMNTAQSEENNCQLSVKAMLPEGFDANCYAVFLNTETNNRYNFPLYVQNNYSQRGFLPDGEYRLVESGVYDDDTAVFKFKPVEDFQLTYGEVKKIELSLENEQEAVDLIASRIMTEKAEEEDSYKKQFTPSDYELKHTGTGTGHVSAQGVPSQAYTLVLKVVSGERPGDMQIAVSTDDGESYSDPVAIPLTGEWSFDNMAYYFEVPETENENGTVTQGTFVVGDTYRYVFFDPAEDFVYTENLSGPDMCIKDNNPEKNPFITATELGINQIGIKVVKGGKAGKAIFVYQLNNSSWSEQMYFPEDGVFHIPDTTLYVELVYSSSGSNALGEGDFFSAEMPKKKIDPLYIMIGVIVVVLAGGYFGIWWFFKSKIVPQGVYTIHEYEPVKKNKRTENNNKEKKKRRKG